jgi:hypothetical protein
VMLRTTVRYYDMAIEAYLGQRLADRLEPLCGEENMEEVRAALAPRGDATGAVKHSGEKGQPEANEWRDLAGLLAPSVEVEEVVAAVSAGEIATLEELQLRLRELHRGYAAAEWSWCLGRLEDRWGCRLEAAGAEELAQVIRKGTDATVKLDSMLESDAGREFDERSRTGYGIDGTTRERDLDFEAVRGGLEENAFVKAIREESRRNRQRSLRLLDWLDTLAAARSSI